MDTKKPEALRLAERISDIHCYTEDDARALAAAADSLCRHHAGIAALRTGYDAARLEIASLQARVQELGQMARDVNSCRVVELESQLAAIGAGGVETLRPVSDDEKARHLKWLDEISKSGAPRGCLHQINEPDHPPGAAKMIAVAGGGGEMSRDDIIAMAHEAGITFVTECGVASATPEWLASFAALVAAKERRQHQADIERWQSAAATAEKWRGLALAKDGDGRTVQRVQEEAAAAEREECARVCCEIEDDLWALYKGRLPYTGREPERGDPHTDGRSDGAGECAAAIRARSAP